MIDRKMEVSQSKPPTQEELLAEALAWGYESWEEYCDALAEASKELP